MLALLIMLQGQLCATALTPLQSLKLQNYSSLDKFALTLKQMEPVGLFQSEVDCHMRPLLLL